MTRVIAAFPATGKSYLAAAVPDVIDSDSSAFSRQPGYWPSNYIAHISNQRHAGRLVLVSTHSEVREALAAGGIPFVLVYPATELREEYRERMERRGSPPALIRKVIDELWDSALAECRAQTGCEHIELRSGEYLADVVRGDGAWAFYANAVGHAAAWQGSRAEQQAED